MEKPKEAFHPGVTPLEQATRDRDAGKDVDLEKAEWDTVIGFERAIEATQNRIIENPENRDLKLHLGSLIVRFWHSIEESIEDTQKRISDCESRRIDTSNLKWHLRNLNEKLVKAKTLT